MLVDRVKFCIVCCCEKVHENATTAHGVKGALFEAGLGRLVAHTANMYSFYCVQFPP